jgi:hypothetical protein
VEAGFVVHHHSGDLRNLRVLRHIQGNGRTSGPGRKAVLWTILALIPIGSLFSFWKYGGLVEGVTNNKYPHRLLFVLLIFMGLAAWLITQLEPNKPATQEA